MSEKLETLAEENKTILCFGIDPNIEKNPVGKIIPFYSDIIDALLDEHAISALKFNYAYFAQYGFDGLTALKELINKYKQKTLIIFDGKRGDIGKSSEAYANEVYGLWNADACTVSPYMGEDSIKPFLRKNKVVYMLCRTSNQGAEDFQELKIGKEFLYEKIASAAIKWKTGLVVGATSDSIKKIVKITNNNVPLLIPGVGAQGGDLEMVLSTIKENIAIHRIAVSSSLAYAYEKHRLNVKDSALKESEILNKKIRAYF